MCQEKNSEAFKIRNAELGYALILVSIEKCVMSSKIAFIIYIQTLTKYVFFVGYHRTLWHNFVDTIMCQLEMGLYYP